MSNDESLEALLEQAEDLARRGNYCDAHVKLQVAAEKADDGASVDQIRKLTIDVESDADRVRKESHQQIEARIKTAKANHEALMAFDQYAASRLMDDWNKAVLDETKHRELFDLDARRLAEVVRRKERY